MTKNSNVGIYVNEDVLEMLLGADTVRFLKNINIRTEDINKELEDLQIKRKRISQKVSEDKKNKNMEPKGLREFTNNCETARESADIIYKNLNNLKKTYSKIESTIEILIEKYKAKNSIEKEMNTLKKNIDKAKELEENIELDNNKNYIIIEGFLGESNNEDFVEEKSINLEELTIENLQDNLVLKISEKKVELPYTKKEVENYMRTYPNDYKTVEDVIRKEFIVHSAIYNRHPILSRFKEAYYLCRTKEMMSVWDSFNYAKNIMFKSNLNSYIIAAVKSKKQLEDYITCLDNDKLNEYKYFKIIFNVTPLAATRI